MQQVTDLLQKPVRTSRQKNHSDHDGRSQTVKRLVGIPLCFLWVAPVWSANPPITATTAVWQRLADMPEGKWGHASVGCENGIYVAGGGDDQGKHTATMFAYDLATNQWRRCADAPTARQSEVLAAVNEKVYWIGGHDSTLGEKGGKTDMCAVYDPRTDQWTVKSPMPTAREDMGSAVIGDEIWIWGGVDNRGHAVTQAVEVYDTVKDSWRTACSVDDAALSGPCSLCLRTSDFFTGWC